MNPYEEAFPVGTMVRIADLHELEEFRETWAYHNPLQPEQFAEAGRAVRVAAVGFYHGGDPLYTLEDTVGVWHESCLRPFE